MEEVIGSTTAGHAMISADARAAALGAVQGPGMRALQLKRQSARIELEHSGRLKPATIINFNPRPLIVYCGLLGDLVIPACNDKIKKSVSYTYGGKKYEGAWVTIREPKFIPWIRDVKPPMDGENPTTDFDAKWALPIELADIYRATYNDVNSLNVGGVVVFEGDIHVFGKGSTLRVARFTTLPDRSRSYYSEEVDKAVLMASVLNQQREHCQFMIQQGDEYDQSKNEIDARNITPVHRSWDKFAIEMGWKKEAARWQSAKFDSEDVCKGCGEPIRRTNAFFCKCGRPFNAFAAFMAGEPVPDSYLFALQGEELAAVKKEMKRRKELRAQLSE